MAELDLNELRKTFGTYEDAPSQSTSTEPAASSLGLFDEDPAERAALSTCHKVLAEKLVTEQQLRKKLVAAEHAPEMVEFALEKCRQSGLLDDAAYARSWVESRIRRGHGARRIHQDLARIGVAKELIDAALVDHQDAGDLDEAAIDAARKKAARWDLEETKVRMRLQRWLLGRGYSYAQADAALRTVRSEQREADE